MTDIKGRNTPYYTDKEIKNQIDKVLHENAMLMQNLGIDSPSKDKREARAKERENLKAIAHLDRQFVNPLISEIDSTWKSSADNQE